MRSINARGNAPIRKFETVVKISSHSYLRLIVLDFIVVHCGANISVKLVAK